MFKFLKNVFTADERPLQLETTEQEPGRFINEGFGGFVSADGTATIRQMKNGRFRLLVNQNEVVATYARRRDAIRGAARRGLTVV
jgi:hypothetical protein